MELFFNELSIHNQFQSKDDFKAAVHQFRMYREVVTNAGLRLYIHRNIFERPTLGITFRKGIQKYFQRQQVRTLMNWFSKDGFFLPDDACADVEDRFVCYFPDGAEEKNKDVTESALGECAFRKIAGEDTGSISLEKSKFSWSPIKIILSKSDEEALIDNDYTLYSLKERLDGLLPYMSSWPMLVERIEHLPNITLEPYVKDKLIINPFSKNIAEGIYCCAKELSEMSTAASLEQFNELFVKYATGTKARFSDSSAGEKRDFKAVLTFDVDDEQRLCPYHGKIKIQQYRIHIVDRPAYQKSIRVVYIGPKLTKR